MTLRKAAFRLCGPSLCVAIIGCCAPAFAQVAQIGGDGSAGNPYVLGGSGDITSYILQNKYVQLSGGGAFTITIPQTAPGTNLVASPATVDPYLNKPVNNGFDTAQNPTINYTGIISGSGSVEVKSGFKPTKASNGSFFDGGVLDFNNNGQTWSLPGASGGTNPSALIIDTNTTVAFSHVSGSSVARTDLRFRRRPPSTAILPTMAISTPLKTRHMRVSTEQV